MTEIDQPKFSDSMPRDQNLECDGLHVFVLHWNRPDECVRTVRELGRQGIPLNITVIDNGSEEKNVQALCRTLPTEVELRRLDRNLGWGAAVNVVLGPWVESGPERYCVVCADDALPEPNCLKLVLKAMDTDPSLGLACPEHEASEVVSLSAFKGVHLCPVGSGSEGSVVVMPAPHGTLSVLRRQCLQAIGIFDERYYAYGDETELGFRASGNGWKSALVLGARVVNPGTATPHRLRAYLFARNNILTVRLYLGPLAALARAVATFCGCINPYWWMRKKGHRLIYARLRGIFDFFAGRFGAPPIEYFD